MLNIIFGDHEGVVTNPAVYFKNTYEDPEGYGQSGRDVWAMTLPSHDTPLV